MVPDTNPPTRPAAEILARHRRNDRSTMTESGYSYTEGPKYPGSNVGSMLIDMGSFYERTIYPCVACGQEWPCDVAQLASSPEVIVMPKLRVS